MYKCAFLHSRVNIKAYVRVRMHKYARLVPLLLLNTFLYVYMYFIALEVVLIFTTSSKVFDSY